MRTIAREVDRAVLRALVGLPSHGHAVCARLGIDASEGAVYPVLHRLERYGLVRSAWADVEGRHRCLYELTGAGAAAVPEAAAGPAPAPAASRALRWSA